jgi:extracellular matrix protein 14
MTLFIPSLQNLVDESRIVVPQSEGGYDLSSLGASTFHDSYHSLEEMDVFGDALASKFGPMGIQVEKFSVGQTWEGREIRGWKARMTSVNAEPVGEREFVVQSGQHAREVCYPVKAEIKLIIQWVGPASALYFLHYLLLEASADKNGEVAKLLKAFTFTIIPTVNPDGYVHSRQSSRMWRKTRQLVDADRGCLG